MATMILPSWEPKSVKVMNETLVLINFTITTIDIVLSLQGNQSE